MPQPSPVAWSRMTVRAVIALCAFTLLATAVAAGAGPATAADLSGAISVNRSGQIYAESVMRQQDEAVRAIKAAQKITKKQLKRARRGLAKNRAALARVTALLSIRRARLAKAEAAHAAAVKEASESDPPADPTTEPAAEPVEGPTVEQLAARVKDARRSVRLAEKRKVKAKKRVRVSTRLVRSKQARLGSLKRQRRVAVSRRESAEAMLGARIHQMTDLAAGRVEVQASVSYATGAAFSWPSPGRIAQVYGCTGYRENPRRGSCRHFHDGVDIVNGHGTAIHSVGVGVVAYVGWNPWDEGQRAWIIVVVHPDGWVSRYGHLTPTNHVRVGEVVHTGQIIGKMGNTGHSSGTHLHLELLRNGSDVNPMVYLPTGVIRVDKTSTKKGKALAKAKAKKKQARAKARRQKAREKAAALELATAGVGVCEPVLRDDESTAGIYATSSMVDALDSGPCAEGPAPGPALEVTGPVELVGRARLAVLPGRTSGWDDLGVVLPMRGTSPTPV